MYHLQCTMYDLRFTISCAPQVLRRAKLGVQCTIYNLQCTISDCHDSSCVMKTSVKSISTLELTTADVLAFPTSTEPPSTV